jgi:hypothetical protein
VSSRWKKWQKWLNRFSWQFAFLGGVGWLYVFIKMIVPDLPSGAIAFAIVTGFMAICGFAGALVISLRAKGSFSPLNCVSPGERWQARLKKEGDHITIELSPFSSDRSRPSDGFEYYDISFKISDS